MKHYNFMNTEDLKQFEDDDENEDSSPDAMDQMKKVDSMEEINLLQKLQNRILQKLIDKIDQHESNTKSINK